MQSTASTSCIPWVLECGHPFRMEEGEKEGKFSPLGLQQGRQESPNVAERVGKPKGTGKERA